MAAIFTSENLDRILTETIPAATNPTHTHAIVATVDRQGVQVVASFVKPAGDVEWTIQAVARHDWGGNDDAVGRVILKW